jgi:hypothetical protein
VDSRRRSDRAGATGDRDPVFPQSGTEPDPGAARSGGHHRESRSRVRGCAPRRGSPDRRVVRHANGDAETSLGTARFRRVVERRPARAHEYGVLSPSPAHLAEQAAPKISI